MVAQIIDHTAARGSPKQSMSLGVHVCGFEAGRSDDLQSGDNFLKHGRPVSFDRLASGAPCFSYLPS